MKLVLLERKVKGASESIRLVPWFLLDREILRLKVGPPKLSPEPRRLYANGYHTSVAALLKTPLSSLKRRPKEASESVRHVPWFLLDRDILCLKVGPSKLPPQPYFPPLRVETSFFPSYTHHTFTHTLSFLKTTTLPQRPPLSFGCPSLWNSSMGR